MLETLQNVWMPKSFFEGSPLERRRSLLVFMLSVVGFCSLLFYFIAHPDYNHDANVVGAIGFGCLLAALLLGAPLRSSRTQRCCGLWRMSGTWPP